MLQYIKNLLPQLQQFSKSLNVQSNFVDKPWIYIDEKGDRHTYIFQKDKSLVMSLNGAVQMGTWQYIPNAESLLIDRGSDKILLKYGFLDKAVMVLRRDDNFDKPWLLIDEKEIPDMDVRKYLNRILIIHHRLKTLNHGDKAYYYSDLENIGLNRNSIFYDENLNKATFSFNLEGDKNYEIEDGIVKNFYAELKLNTDKGIVNILSKHETLSVGDSAFLNAREASDGYYALIKSSTRKGFNVVNGKVSSIIEKLVSPIILAVGFVIFIAIILVVYYTGRNKNVGREIARKNCYH